MSPRPSVPDRTGSLRRPAPGVAGLSLAAAVLFAPFADAQTVSITSTPASGSTYGAGETITTRLSGLAAFAGGNPAIATMTLDVGGVERQASSTTSFSNGLTSVNFSYTVTVDDRDTDGIAIPANSVDAGGSIWVTLGSVPITANHAALSNQAGHRVDGYRGAPGVIGLELNSPLGTAPYFERDDVIDATVRFTQAVDVTGTPQLALNIGSNTRQASYVGGTGTTRLVFRYVVVSTDSDPNGISIAAAALTLNSGTIVLAGGSTNALLGLGSRAISNSANHRVDGSLLTPAAVNGASITSRPRAGGSYGPGERIEVGVRFNRAVDVTGTPQLALTIGARTRQADYASGTGTTTLSFSYEVAADDVDENGFSVPRAALTLNGGEIDDARSATAAADLDLGTNAIGDAAGHRVNDTLGGPPGPAPARPADVTAAVDDGGGRVTLGWSHPRDPSVTGYQYRLQQGEQPPGPWLPVEDSDGDTTSVTIDLATGAARAGADAVAGASPPAVEWTIWVRAWSRGGPGLSARTVVSAAPVPAVPAAWLGVQAVLLLWCRRKRGRSVSARRSASRC